MQTHIHTFTQPSIVRLAPAIMSNVFQAVRTIGASGCDEQCSDIAKHILPVGVASQ
jgi:hypothetical protein